MPTYLPKPGLGTHLTRPHWPSRSTNRAGPILASLQALPAPGRPMSPAALFLSTSPASPVRSTDPAAPRSVTDPTDPF